MAIAVGVMQIYATNLDLLNWIRYPTQTRKSPTVEPTGLSSKLKTAVLFIDNVSCSLTMYTIGSWLRPNGEAYSV